ncbi:MAG: RNase adaptor protein RapZ, partial [Bifidobacteriaceae bacterium]|nr:RNase adaptor protein RapZ [Bifidobacteriaceae bacterium]
LQDGDTILQGIARERRLLASLRARADVIIDTSDLSVHDLARRMERFTETEGRTGPDLQVSVESFGFKYGLPLDANFVLDVRFLDNPYWIDELRHLNGLDQPVRDYVLGLPGAGEFIDRYTSALLLALKGSAEQRQRHVTVAVGCTGGKHRSVAIAEAIAGLVARAGYHVQAHHRDLGRE